MLKSPIVLPLIFTVCLSTLWIWAPMPSIASKSTLISFTSGRLSIVTVSSVIIAAARIASAAFFAPPISTSPTSGLPPLIIYCSISHLYCSIYFTSSDFQVIVIAPSAILTVESLSLIYGTITCNFFLVHGVL